MKKSSFLVGIIVVLYGFMVGCSLEQGTVKEDAIRSEKEIIEEVTQEQIQAIRDKDLETYLNTLDQSQPEYMAERKNWFVDLKNHDITNFYLTIISVDKISKDKFSVQMRQSYDYEGKSYEIDFKTIFITQRGRWVDSDLAFNKLETQHFIIKYLEGAKEHAEVAALGAEEALKMVIDRTGMKPKGRTVIKLYRDKELLRQSVKLSFPWQFAGWYEYPESIKSLAYDNQSRYREVIAHELIHKLTITSSNNNLPYWLSEGLAMYYTEFYRQDETLSQAVKKSDLLSIKALEATNLEAITDLKLISNYYKSSGRIVQFIAKTYGEEALLNLVNRLGEYGYIQGTGIEVDQVSVKRLHEIFPEVLGLSVEALDEKWQDFSSEAMQ